MFRSFFFLALLWNTVNASQILDDFKSKGYHEMLNERCGKEYLTNVYSQLDALITFIDTHQEWAQKLYDVDKEFTKSYENSLYGNPPIGYIDDRKSKKSKKNYFHFSLDYLNFINKTNPNILSGSSALSDLLKSLYDISNISEKKFVEAIRSIGDPALLNAMRTEDGRFLTLIKVVRYEPSDLAASNPHFDFSGLSFLFDNSESYECESLLLAPYTENITVEAFAPPKRYYKKSSTESSLLLIPGLALKHIGIPIHPTPHAVKKQDKQRYAIIVFAMVPKISLTYDEIKLRQIKLPELQCTKL